MPLSRRSLIKVYVFGIITLGIYFIFWLIKTKNEMNSLGAEIPTAWLLIIPIANIYWLYRYAEGFSKFLQLFSPSLTKLPNQKLKDLGFNIIMLGWPSQV